MQFNDMLEVSRAARRMGPDFPGYLSSGEACVAALVLNRPDYLKAIGRTMAEAIYRLDAGDADQLIRVQQTLQNELPITEA